VKVLVDNGAKVNSVDYEKQTCLHEVSRVGDVLVIKVRVGMELLVIYREMH